MKYFVKLRSKVNVKKKMVEEKGRVCYDVKLRNTL